MRRLTLLALAGVLGLSACSDQNTESPTEPSVGPPSESFGSTCDHGRYPLASVAAQANDASLWKNKPARVEALLRLGTIALLWDTCHDQLARKAALDMILWIDKNTARNVDQTKVAALKAAILAGFGGASTSDADFVSEVYIPGTTKVITTPSAKATIKLTPGAFDEPTLITVRRLPNDFQLTDVTEGYDQEPPYWDYDATNSSTDNTLETHKVGLVNGVPAATIAFCFREDDGTEHTYFPEPGASIGHNPVGGGFEIVDEVDPGDLAEELSCIRAPVIGSADGLRGFSRYLASMAMNVLLPAPLQAATVGTRGPIAGTPISLSPFGIVRPSALELNLLQEPNDHDSENNHFVNSFIVPCSLVREDIGGDCRDLLVGMQNSSGAAVGTGRIVTASLIVINKPTGTTPILEGDNTQPIANVTLDLVNFFPAATFADLSINVPGRYQLKFEAPGASPVISEEFDVYDIAFTIQPVATNNATIQEGQLLGLAAEGFENPVVQVSILDYQGLVVPGASDLVMILMPVLGLTLNGDARIHAQDGVANFTQVGELQTGLSIDIDEQCGDPPTVGRNLLAQAGRNQISSFGFSINPSCPEG